MQWTDKGIILGTKKHGERNAIAEIYTEHHGRHLGLVKYASSKAMRSCLQPGNTVNIEWRARLDEHLGAYSLEPETHRAARLIECPIGIYAIQAIASLLRLLPERDSYPYIYNYFNVMLDHLDNPFDVAGLYIRLELAVLNELGFGLDLSKCAQTG